MSFSTIRPAPRAAKNRCGQDSRDNSRWKPRCCARVASPDIAAGATVAELIYVLLKGGEPAGEAKALAFKDGTPDSQADRALEKLTGAGATFR